MEAVEDTIRQEGTHYEKFLDVLECELELTVAKTLRSKISYHLQETQERANHDQCTEQETASSLAPTPAKEDKEHKKRNVHLLGKLIKKISYKKKSMLKIYLWSPQTVSHRCPHSLV